MFRQNMSGPISVLLAGVIVIFLLLAGSGSNTSATTRRQNSTPTWTPCNIDDNDCIDFQDHATQTASAIAYPAVTPTETPLGYVPPDGDTATTTGTATGTSITGTDTPTTSAAITPTQGTPTPSPARSPGPNASTAPPSDTTQPAEAIPTETPTPTNAFTCTPGVPIEIAGDGPPRAPLLLYFAERPVGGGSVAVNGRFALKLIVGQERAGEYKVTVRVRGTSQVLRQVTCSVPNVTPTPLPSALER